jgi:hypothetical protein
VLNRRSRLRFLRKSRMLECLWKNGRISEGEYQIRLTALYGFAKHTDIRKLNQKTESVELENFASELGISRERTGST